MDQTLAILTNLYYKLFVSTESRFLPIHGQQGKFYLSRLNVKVKIRPKMGVSGQIVQDIQGTKSKKLVEENQERKWGSVLSLT